MPGAALQFGSGGPVNLPGPPTPVKIPPSHFAPESKVRIPVKVNGQVTWVTKPKYEKFSPQGYASKCRALKRAATEGGLPIKMTPLKRLKIEVANLTRALEEERRRRGNAEARLTTIYHNRRESARFLPVASERNSSC